MPRYMGAAAALGERLNGLRTKIGKPSFAHGEVERALRPSLRREADSLTKKQIGAAAKLAADDLRLYGEPEERIGARVAAVGFTAEQVLGDWFPERVG
jgi:hypothetical protein